jgi:hypothetical protein
MEALVLCAQKEQRQKKADLYTEDAMATAVPRSMKGDVVGAAVHRTGAAPQHVSVSRER